MKEIRGCCGRTWAQKHISIRAIISWWKLFPDVNKFWDLRHYIISISISWCFISIARHFLPPPSQPRPPTWMYVYLYLPSLPSPPPFALPMTTRNASFKSLPHAEVVCSVLSEIPKKPCIPLPNNKNNNVRWKHVWEEHVVNNISVYEKS